MAERSPTVTVETHRKKNTNKAIAICLALVLLSVAVVGVVISIDHTSDNRVQEKIETQTIDDDTYFELSGDFLPERGILSAGFNNEGQMTFTLDEDLASNYTFYSWHFYDSTQPSSELTYLYSEYTGNYVNKAEPVLYYTTPSTGSFEITVECYTGESNDYKLAATYSGNVTYIDQITETYEWNYLGTNYSIDLTYSFKDFLDYSDTNTNGRSVRNYGDVRSFITYDDPLIVGLADSLLSEYGGNAQLDQDFASYVLAFIQICFDYPPYTASGLMSMSADMYLYGQDEYFAYPIETIYYGMGDCEDTSILAAAVYKALGFDAGVVIIPGHAVAAVALDDYVPGTYSHIRFEILSKEIDGRTYYGCETTVDSFQEIGLITLSGFNGRPYSSYIDTNGYGFYVV